MPSDRRELSDCKFLRFSHSNEHECQLLQQLVGVDLELCKVPEGACEACCQSFPPSASDPNPVVASLLYQLCENIIALNGSPGCSAEQAVQLREYSLECLPKTTPTESDRPVTEVPDYDRPSTCSLDELIPASSSDYPIKTWSVGVTTAHRRLPTVDECLDSVVNAGWETIRIFSDAAVPLSDRHSHQPCTLREPSIGAWPNFYLSLAELLMREPETDAYLMIQDDALFFNHRGLKTYLELALWQTDKPCLASLFCPRDYTQPTHGWCEFQGEWVWGAQAFAFSRSAAQLFLADQEVVHHRWNSDYKGLYGIDVLIGRWASRCGVPISFPTPSLVQHIGHVSAIWDRAHISGPRRADRFAGDVESE